YPPLASRCALEAGLLYEQRALPAKAIALLSKVDDQSWVFPDARLGLSRVYKAKGDLKQASAVLQPLLSWPLQRQVRSKVLLELAALAEQRHDKKGERDALEQLATIGAWWARQVGFRLGS